MVNLQTFVEMGVDRRAAPRLETEPCTDTRLQPGPATRLVVHPRSGGDGPIDVTHQVVELIARELWKLRQGNDVLNWLEAEAMLEDALASLRQPHAATQTPSKPRLITESPHRFENGSLNGRLEDAPQRLTPRRGGKRRRRVRRRLQHVA